VLNLALLVLGILVASTLLLLLRSPAPVTAVGTMPDDPPPAEGDNLDAPSGHPDMRVSTSPQADERAPNH